MTRRLIGAAAAVVLYLSTSAVPAWAVAGNVAVTITTGAEHRPVKGAKVRIGDQVATTDAQGEAELRVEEGNRTLVVDHPEFVREPVPVTVVGGRTTRSDVSLMPVFPFNVQNPAGQFGGFTVGALGLFQRDDLRYTREVERIFVNGNEVATFLNGSPQAFEMKVNYGAVDASVGFPGFKLIGWQFDPAVSGMIGGADVQVKNTSNDFTASGGGVGGGLGLELAAVPSSTPQLHLAAGWQGSWLRASDLDTRVRGGGPLCPALFPTATSCRDRAEVSSDTYELYVRAGYSLFNNRVAPFAGLKYRWTDVRFETESDATIGSSQVRDRLEIDFQRSDCLLGIAGVDVRGPDVGRLGSVFGRVQTEFGGSGFSVLFKLMYAFGFVDP